MKSLCNAYIMLIFFASLCSAEIKVVSTTGMINDVVKNIGGNRVHAVGLINSGVDPHLYKATRSDIAKLTSADLVFYNGLFLEGKLVDAFNRLKNAGRKVVAVTEGIDKEYLIEPKEFAGHFDPHVWMDPTAWSLAAKVVKRELINLDPQGKSYYEEKANQYLAKLKQLDKYADQVLGSIPKESRIIVTAHDAFNYLGKRYGIKVLGIQGLSTESEAGVRDIEMLVDLLVSKKVKAVFVESTVSTRSIKALIEGASARGHKVEIGGELFSDAMGKEGTYLGTYIGMIDHNVTSITKALGGSTPKAGFQGKLSE